MVSVTLENVYKGFGKIEVVHGVGLDIRDTEGSISPLAAKAAG
jgi:ABC-type sugar transport system ATPase subunit